MGGETTMSEHNINDEHALTILKSMTGTVNHWKAGRASKYTGDKEYLSITPVTCMENLQVRFYTQCVNRYDWEKDTLTQDTMDELVTAFKKSRKWKLETNTE